MTDTKNPVISPKLGVIVFLDIDKYLEHVGSRGSTAEYSFIVPISRLVDSLSRKHGFILNRSFGDAFLLHRITSESEAAYVALCQLLCEIRDNLANQNVSFKAAVVRGVYIEANIKNGDHTENSMLIGPAPNFAGKLISSCPRGTVVISWPFQEPESLELSLFDAIASSKRAGLRSIALAQLTFPSDPLVMGSEYQNWAAAQPDNEVLESAQPQSQFNTQTKYHILETIKLADDKAKAVFGISGALLVYLFNRGGAAREVLAFTNHARLDSLIISLQSVGVAGLLVSCIFSVLVIIPRTKTAYRGLIFFGSIAAWESSDDYAAQIMGRSQIALETENAKHNYEMSLVNIKKYRALRVCIVSLAVSLAFILAAFGIEKAIAISLKL